MALEILRKLRIKKGITQLQLAEILSRPQSYISKYESGERKLEVVEFIDVCRALGEEPSQVLNQIERELRRVY